MESIYNTDESALSLPRARQATMIQFSMLESDEPVKRSYVIIDDLENACKRKSGKVP